MLGSTPSAQRHPQRTAGLLEALQYHFARSSRMKAQALTLCRAEVLRAIDGCVMPPMNCGTLLVAGKIPMGLTRATMARGFHHKEPIEWCLRYRPSIIH